MEVGFTEMDPPEGRVKDSHVCPRAKKESAMMTFREHGDQAYSSLRGVGISRQSPKLPSGHTCDVSMARRWRRDTIHCFRGRVEEFPCGIWPSLRQCHGTRTWRLHRSAEMISTGSGGKVDLRSEG